MNRTEMIDRVNERDKIWDFLIIGGGATGIGCAVDAASRGFSVLLLEQNDFGKGTSSRSTKLIHGGVRYLAQGNISLVKEALRERGILLKNAPHLVHKQAFIVPVFSYRDKFFYGAGLKTYDLLAGKYGFGKSEILSKKETLEMLPNVKEENLEGGILYFDGQFDDTRLLINLAQTAVREGATLINYARVFALHRDENGKIAGAAVSDEISGQIFLAQARVVINATGAFCDTIRRFSDKTAEKIIAPSQGIHLVFDRKFLSSENALMIPKTSDGRVLFAIPWHEHALFGTTDTPLENPELEPKARSDEIEFILENARNYLQNPPEKQDILSVFVGVRPLVKSAHIKNTASLSRDHTIEIDGSNLLTITGGKWTTYRRMAEDAVNQATRLAGLSERKCVTEDLRIYSSDAEEIEKIVRENPSSAEKIHEKLNIRKAEILWAIRGEMAQTVEDVLARRTRALFLNAQAAFESAIQVIELMRQEMNKDENWVTEQKQTFSEVAKTYLPEIS
jgi:glycerol-3-phosphate dehydrogenase